jgi:hypothetical protein
MSASIPGSATAGMKKGGASEKKPARFESHYRDVLFL